MQVAACLVALAISKAPGWRRARIGAALAGTAALYAFFDLLGAILPRTGAPITMIWSANLTIAATHVAVWVWYSFSDERGRWNSVPRVMRWILIGHVLWTASLGLAGNVVDLSLLQRVQVPWLGVDFVQPSLRPLATLSAAISLVILVVCFGEQVRQARRGVIGAKWNAVGFIVFLSCAVEEVLVASGALKFIYLAEVGYLGLVIPVIGQFVRRFLDDAHRLQDLTLVLEAQVNVATGERDAAREALTAQERFAALGRMAEGVGHEINNPLQILSLSLDELREMPAVASDAEAAEMVEQASGASDRIGRIVTGLRTYAIKGEHKIERLGAEVLVRDAIEEAKATLGPLPELHTILDPVPRVLVDRDRMMQALTHAIANAVRAVSTLPEDRRRVELRTRTTAGGDALIAVRDNGAGFPASVLSRLGEPFVTTSDPGAGPGLGIFIIRGVVAAHGGMLELENVRGGGAALQILLPPAARG